MAPEGYPARDEKLHDALNLMERALQLLDDGGCSADVGAHLDLAICRLRDILPESGVDRTLPNMVPPAKMPD